MSTTRPVSPSEIRAVAATKAQPACGLVLGGVFLEMCEQAKDKDGEKFMENLSKILNADVIGWTGWFEGWPTGERWMVNKEGKWTHQGTASMPSVYPKVLSALDKAMEVLPSPASFWPFK